MQAAIEQREKEIAEIKRREDQKKAWMDETYVPQQLELSIAGAFAFWVTVGLLVAWAIRRNGLTAVDADGVARCFWAVTPEPGEARDALRRYHDHEHGTPPATDRELLERLALDVLLEGRHWEKREWLRQRLVGLPPDDLARMDAEAAAGLAGDPGEREVLANRAAIEMVVENARRLQALYRENAPGARTGSRDLLLADWAARARESGTGLLDHVRGGWRIAPQARLGTFVVSLGFAGPAHIEGCARRPTPHHAPVQD